MILNYVSKLYNLIRVFSTIESDITKSGQALSIFGKELQNVYHDFNSAIHGIKTKTGDISQFSIGRILGNKLSQQDIDSIRRYNDEIRKYNEMTDDAVTPQTAFYKCLGNSSSAAQKLARDANGAAISEETLKVASQTSTVALKAQSIAMNLLGNVAITAIIIGISKFVKYLSDLANHIEITRKKVEDLKSTFKSALDTANSNAKRVEELADRYDKLSKGVNNLGENVSLTNEEYDEYNTLVNEIADMFPTLVQGYTDEGNAIINLKNNVKDLRDAYKEAQQEAYNLLIVNGKDTDGNDIIQQWKDLKDTGFLASAFDLGMQDVDGSISVVDALEQLQEIQNMSAERYREIERIVASGTTDEIRSLSDIEEKIARGSYLQKALGLTWNISDEDFANAKKQASVLAQTYNAQIESSLADVKTLANAYLMTNEDYDKLDDQSKNIASILTNSLDFDTANGFKSKEDVGVYVESILTKLKESEPEIQSAFNELLSLDTKNLSLSEAKKQVDSSIQKLSSYLGIDENQLKISFGFEFVDENFDELQNILNRAKEKFNLNLDWTNVVEGEHGVNTKEEIALLAECIDATDSMTKALELYDVKVSEVATTTEDATKTFEELQEAYDELSKSASSYVSNQKTLNSALEEQKEYGQLSAKTIQDLIDAGYAQALVYDDVTGAMTLNQQTLELLNTLKKREIELDLQKQETDLVTIYDEERSKIAELNKELANTNSLRAQEIINELTALETTHKLTTEQLAQVRKLKESLNAPNYDSSGGGSGKKETPTEIQNFLDDYAKYHHDINMGIKKEDEDYFNWLEKAAHDAYSKYPDYQDDLWKYEEEVYKGRKQLAEDYFDEQQKLFEDRVSNLETQIEITTKTSESSDGTKLNTKEKYDDIRSGYQEIINIIEERINEIVQAGVEGHEDLLAELEKQIEEYQEKLSDVFKSAVEEEKDYIEKQKDAFSDAYDERIDKIKEEKEAAEEAAQAEIDALEEKINALEKANEKAEEANDIEEKRQALEKAKNQRTIATVSASGAISYQADPEAVQKAQEELDNALFEQQINLLEDQKDLLEKSKDKQSEAYDDIIENLTSQKEEGERQFDILLKVLDDYLNPDKSTSNIDVWSILAKTEGIKLGKNGQWVNKDGKVIDIEKLMKSSQTETDAEKNVGNNSSDNKNNTNGTKLGRIEKKQLGSENETELSTESETISETESALDKLLSNWEKMFDLEKGSLTIEKVQQVLINSPTMKYNPYGAMNDRMNKVYRNEYVSNVNNNNSDSNVTFSGDININNPVANSYDLAEDIVKNLPNAVAKQIHKKNQ